MGGWGDVLFHPALIGTVIFDAGFLYFIIKLIFKFDQNNSFKAASILAGCIYLLVALTRAAAYIVLRN